MKSRNSVIQCSSFSNALKLLALAACMGFLINASIAQSIVKTLPDDTLATDTDKLFIKRAYEIAQNAVANGNHPFGALLVHNGKIVAEFENEVVTTNDLTKHAETGLIGFASKKLSRKELAECTLYTSTEPCLMCCGAIYWAGIQKIVFGTSESQMDIQIDAASRNYRIPSIEVFQRINPKMIIIGPVMEDAGLKIHALFWPEFRKRNKND